MKRILLVVTAVAASLLLNVAAVQAAGEPTVSGTESQVTTQKDECLLVAMNCPDEALTLHQRVDRLNAEIDKGEAVYTDEELGVLQKQLDEAFKELESRTDINVYLP